MKQPRTSAGRPCRKVRAKHTGHGFTLIELMVVIALVGIAAVMIIPEMKGSYEDALLRSASRELVDTFQLAYSRAVSLNQTHRVRIEESSGKYAIEAPLPRSAMPRRQGRASGDGLAAGEAEAEFRPLTELPGYTGKLDDRIRVRIRPPGEDDDETNGAPAAETGAFADARSLLFYADGTAAAREVLLQDRHGYAVVLSLNPVTARVKITHLGRK